MISFSKYKTILYDFDGVLMDSMPVREAGFQQVLADYPEKEVLELLDYHRQNGGLSRYVKFRYFFEVIRKEPVDEEMIMTLASSFSEVMMKHLINPALLIQDSVNFVKKHHQKFAMHIVSGSDGQELNSICNRLGLSQYFLSIHGSPTPKGKLVADLLKQNNYAAVETILIGDARNDWEAANANGIDFCGYNNEALSSISMNYIHSFSRVG